MPPSLVILPEIMFLCVSFYVFIFHGIVFTVALLQSMWNEADR